MVLWWLGVSQISYPSVKAFLFLYKGQGSAAYLIVCCFYLCMFNYWTPTVSNQRRLYSYCVFSLNRMNLSLFFNLLLSLLVYCCFCCCFADRSTNTVSKDTSLLGSQIYWNNYTNHKTNTLLRTCVCACAFSRCVCLLLPPGRYRNKPLFLYSTKENNYHSCKRKEGGVWLERETEK